MLVNIEATKLKENVHAMNIVTFVYNRGNGLRLGSNSRDVDELIKMNRAALLKFNPDLSGRDIETVYMELTDCIAIGVIKKDNGMLKGCWDSSNDHVFQLHIDNTMAVFCHRKGSVRKGTHDRDTHIVVPNKQAYKDLYFCPHIFVDYLDSISRGKHSLMNKDDLATYIESKVSTSADIVKDKGKMSTKQADILRDFVINYGRLISLTPTKGETPEKYIISDKWLKEVHMKFKENPYFIFRHVWRCYFKLACEGHLI